MIFDILVPELQGSRLQINIDEDLAVVVFRALLNEGLYSRW
ncbi:MAG TPA: hypothetical protein VJ766_08160 [Pseudoxanthomonas sp.]|nr:hypothetical protein [Pseudoxanthomonas sp.]